MMNGSAVARRYAERGLFFFFSPSEHYEADTLALIWGRDVV